MLLEELFSPFSSSWTQYRLGLLGWSLDNSFYLAHLPMKQAHGGRLVGLAEWWLLLLINSTVSLSAWCLSCSATRVLTIGSGSEWLVCCPGWELNLSLSQSQLRQREHRRHKLLVAIACHPYSTTLKQVLFPSCPTSGKLK